MEWKERERVEPNGVGRNNAAGKEAESRGTKRERRD